MKHVWFWVLIFVSFGSFAQNFAIDLQEIEIPGIPGLQSFAWAQYEGHLVLVGGRLDGLHRRQPWASFDIAGHNTDIVVVDIQNRQTWRASVNNLPDSFKEQLSATNINFHQEGQHLFLVGGYGYSPTSDDHKTFASLIVVDLENLIHDVKSGNLNADHFDILADEQFAVTGGRLLKIYDDFYLVGGQRFDGRYNPMNHPTFVQKYTDAVRRFKIQEIQSKWTVTHLPAYENTDLFHRRDLNVAPIINEDGEEALVIYSGVFRQDADLPFLNAVYVDSSEFHEIENLTILYNHYHCAHVPLYDAEAMTMNTLFFGGIAQYYLDNDNLVRDDNVPFVKTIANIGRNSNGDYYEEALDISMPYFLGAGAEFVVREDIPKYDNGVVKFHELDDGDNVIGYIVGGIESSQENIFFTNDGTQSRAVPSMWEVKLKKMTTGVQDQVPIEVSVFPNPASDALYVNLNTKSTAELSIDLMTIDGRLLERLFEGRVGYGRKALELELPDLKSGVLSMVRIMADDILIKEVKLIVNDE